MCIFPLRTPSSKTGRSLGVEANGGKTTDADSAVAPWRRSEWGRTVCRHCALVPGGRLSSAQMQTQVDFANRSNPPFFEAFGTGDNMHLPLARRSDTHRFTLEYHVTTLLAKGEGCAHLNKLHARI